MAFASRSTFQLSALALALASIGAPAATINWATDANGLWTIPVNWSPAGLPGSNDDVLITNVTGLKTITHNTGSDTIRSLTTNASALVVVSGGSSLSVNSGASTNGGVFRADGAGSTFAFNNGSLTNNGTLNATNSGTIALNNLTVSGGILSTTTGGTITFGGGTVLDASTNGAMTTSGSIVQSDNATSYIKGTINNSGDIRVGTNADLRIQSGSDLTLNGSGTLTLVAGNSRIFGDANSATLTNGASHAIQGVGQIGINQLNIINQGLITANVNGGTLQIDPTDGPTGLINTGTLRAENGGALNLVTGTYKNVGGTVSALTGSSVTLTNSAVLQGGTLSTAGTGSIVLTGSAYLDGASLGNVTNNGKLVTADNSTAYISGTINDNSTITIGANSDLRIKDANNLTLAGAGTLTMNAFNSRIFGDQNSDILTNTVNHTIQGQGQIGINTATIVNQGLITSNVLNGTIQIDPTDGTNGFINTGTLRAENGGQMNLVTSTYNNTGGTIEARAGSNVLVTNSAVVQGGTLTSAGTGAIRFEGSAVLDGSTHGAIVNTATHLNISDNQTVYALGTINDTTGIQIGANADLRVQGSSNLTFAGNGAATLTAFNSRLFGDVNSDVITNTSNHTIQGTGQLGVNTGVFVNQGLITANQSGGTLQIDPTDGADGVLNTGTLRADAGGQLNLINGTFNNQNGTIEARNGSIVLASGAIIQGGLLTATSGNSIQVLGSSVLDGLSHGQINTTGNLQFLDSQTNYATGTLNNSGAITIGVNADLRLQGSSNLTLAGNGTLTMAAGNSRLFGDANTDVITNSATHTIQGQGQIGVNTGMLVNRGLVVATAGVGITIDPTDGVSGVVNTGTLRADGGQLSLVNGTFNNAGGQIQGRNGSAVVFSNATLQGGTLATSGGSVVQVTGSSVLDGTTNGTINNTGALQFNASQTNYAIGTINNTGTMILGANSDTRLQGTRNLTLTGAGTMTLTASNTRVFGDINTNLLTNGAGHTINGQGQVGVNTLEVTNAGTIAANVSGATLNLNSTSATVNQATGVLQATSGGTLYIDKAVTGTGTIQSDTGGAVILNQAAATGRLINNANLTIGTNNVTVSADYSNANFGSGNAFNKHANVTGTGQILAAGTTAQAVTGANVTNGTSGTPTLTIGNVRVGGTTYNYQVANTGTTGPAIRGAIQTGVNGGNITDARLSGTGVTASNYGPVATGSNSGNLGVTFTVASAGALAPLSGQAVHIANNFDNVGEQTLNIALAGGAAAYNAAIGSATPSPATLGNTRIGGTLSQTFTVRNTQTAGSFSEDLNAAFGSSTGAATSGSVSGLVAGGVNSSAMSASLNTATSGAKNGSVTIDYATAGAVNGVGNGLGTLGVGSQTIALSGNVYQTAAGTILTAPLNFGTVQVGQVVSQNLAIQNSATGAAGFVEDLNASFGASSGTGASRITGSGSVNGLTAGSTSNGLTVGVNTASAGAVNGSIAVNFVSAGAVGGVGNGLGTLAVGSAGYGVVGNIQSTANVVDQASPVINNSPIALGNVRIGSTSPTGLVSVTNQATGNQQAALNATIAGNAPITASGSFNLLAPGATNATSLSVGLDTSSAGNKNGTATVSFVSDAGNIGGCGTACQLNIGTQNVAVTGAVYRLANPNATPATITVAGRVGSASPTSAITIANASPDIYTEGLTVSRGATSSGFSSTGGITNLVAGGSSTAIGVTLNTAIAGTFGGTQALNYVSTGAGTTGAADFAIGSGSVTLNGKVYTPAVATVNTPAVNFGIVHVGDSATRGVSVTNTASTTALNDVLVASALGATGPFTAAGNLGAGLAAQQTSTSGLQVGLNTATAGVYSGQASFSAASHDADLTDAALANLAVSLSGQVNNYAADAFTFTTGAGTLTRSGSTFVLDYGTVAQGSGTLSTTLAALNSATGPADALDGAFQFLDAADFGESGFAAFLNLVAGQATGPLTLAFDTMTLGSFMDTIVLHGVGHNASGYSASLGDIQLVVRGNVTGQVTPPTPGVPEPDSLLLLGLGVPLLFLRRGRKAAHPAAHPAVQ